MGENISAVLRVCLLAPVSLATFLEEVQRQEDDDGDSQMADSDSDSDLQSSDEAKAMGDDDDDDDDIDVTALVAPPRKKSDAAPEQGKTKPTPPRKARRRSSFALTALSPKQQLLRERARSQQYTAQQQKLSASLRVDQGIDECVEGAGCCRPRLNAVFSLICCVRHATG